jgi:hypothetical protein
MGRVGELECDLAVREMARCQKMAWMRLRHPPLKTRKKRLRKRKVYERLGKARRAGKNIFFHNFLFFA